MKKRQIKIGMIVNTPQVNAGEVIEINPNHIVVLCGTIKTRWKPKDLEIW